MTVTTVAILHSLFLKTLSCLPSYVACELTLFTFSSKTLCDFCSVAQNCARALVLYPPSLLTSAAQGRSNQTIQQLKNYEIITSSLYLCCSVHLSFTRYRTGSETKSCQFVSTPYEVNLHFFGNLLRDKMQQNLQTKICFVCQEYTNHAMSKCPKLVCKSCKKLGHAMKNCPDLIMCKSCGSKGHVAKNCPSKLTENLLKLETLSPPQLKNSVAESLSESAFCWSENFEPSRKRPRNLDQEDNLLSKCSKKVYTKLQKFLSLAKSLLCVDSFHIPHKQSPQGGHSTIIIQRFFWSDQPQLKGQGQNALQLFGLHFGFRPVV